MITSRWQITTAATVEPIPLADAKEHLRVDHTDDDDEIGRLIQTAREYAESILARAIASQSITAYYMTWPYCSGAIHLPRAAPLQSVTSVKYVDPDGVLQTLDSSVYDVLTYAEPGEVRLAEGQSWPSHRYQTDPVRIEYACGWADIADVPEPVKQLLRFLIGHYYENREASSPIDVRELPMGVKSLMSANRVGWQ